MPQFTNRNAVQIRARPNTTVVAEGEAILLMDNNGFIKNRNHGFFYKQARLLSKYRYLIDGKEPLLVTGSTVFAHSWLGYYIQSAGTLGHKKISECANHAVEVKVSRFVGDGLHEEIAITNYSGEQKKFVFAIEIDADFGDLSQMQRAIPELLKRRQWRPQELIIHGTAENKYRHADFTGTASFDRQSVIRWQTTSKARHAGNQLYFNLVLEPQQQWSVCIDVIPVSTDRELKPEYPPGTNFSTVTARSQLRQQHMTNATTFDIGCGGDLAHVVVECLEQATCDLLALRLYEYDRSPRSWTIEAGLPIYAGLFGRDSLTAAWQSAISSSDIMHGTLETLAQHQGKKTTDRFDERPGRMIHQVYTGPLEELQYNPFLHYFGSNTTSALYAMMLSEFWHWTGDKNLVKQLIPNARKALDYLDRYTPKSDSGFYKYQTRSSQGIKNQAWKDSSEAIVYDDGTQVEPPIATCEEQGFAYLSMVRMAEMLWFLGEKDESKHWFAKASEFKKRFNDVFWMPDKQYIALGLDPYDRQIESITSNPGHCVATAILDDALVPPVVNRMFADDLFSGWGIRTLSADHPAYNPYSYQRGSVWPVEQATFALGLVRYGLSGRMHQLCKGMFEATALFDFKRLPEVFAGHPRDAEHPFPAIYPNANWPQAWSSSAVFCFLQSMLQLYPFAPMDTLFIDPQLPEWLPTITLRHLSVGNAKADIRFFRKSSGDSGYEILSIQGKLHVIRQPSPWSLTAGPAERIADLVGSFLH